MIIMWKRINLKKIRLQRHIPDIRTTIASTLVRAVHYYVNTSLPNDVITVPNNMGCPLLSSPIFHRNVHGNFGLHCLNRKHCEPS